MPKCKFPKGFLWGASTAAHQVEGNNINDWSICENEKYGHNSGEACDSYNRYLEDAELIKSLGHNAHRISIEWSRIFPEKDKININALKHYRDVLLSLKNKNIKTFVTLHHFTNPIWFSRMGAFEDTKNFKYFFQYVSEVTAFLKDYVDFWITINEPNTYILKSYLIGIWTPFNKNIFTAIKVYSNLCKVHVKTYKIIKNIDSNAQVGAAHQVVWYYPKNKILDYPLSVIQHELVNNFFYRKTKDYHDYVGTNYYFKNPVKFRYLFANPDKNDLEDIVRDKGQKFGWDMDPEGIYDVIGYLQKNFKLPIYILEHGISDPSDSRRILYIKKFLKKIHKKIKEGADIRGYLHWSLIDNYEWNLGYNSKFGLVGLEEKTLNRIPKKSAIEYKNICINNEIH